jgi:hypothetical protein
MRAEGLLEIQKHKKPGGIPSGFFVFETVVISTHSMSPHWDDFGDVFKIFVGA